jgi:hypothetical protein
MAMIAGGTFLLTTRGPRVALRRLPRVFVFIAATTLELFVTLPAGSARAGVARLGMGWSLG